MKIIEIGYCHTLRNNLKVVMPATTTTYSVRLTNRKTFDQAYLSFKGKTTWAKKTAMKYASEWLINNPGYLADVIPN